MATDLTSQPVTVPVRFQSVALADMVVIHCWPVPAALAPDLQSWPAEVSQSVLRRHQRVALQRWIEGCCASFPRPAVIILPLLAGQSNGYRTASTGQPHNARVLGSLFPRQEGETAACWRHAASYQGVRTGLHRPIKYYLRHAQHHPR